VPPFKRSRGYCAELTEDEMALPGEVLHYTFRHFLEGQDVVRAAGVCGAWRRLCMGVTSSVAIRGQTYALDALASAVPYCGEGMSVLRLEVKPLCSNADGYSPTPRTMAMAYQAKRVPRTPYPRAPRLRVLDLRVVGSPLVLAHVLSHALVAWPLVEELRVADFCGPEEVAVVRAAVQGFAHLRALTLAAPQVDDVARVLGGVDAPSLRSITIEESTTRRLCRGAWACAPPHAAEPTADVCYDAVAEALAARCPALEHVGLRGGHAEQALLGLVRGAPELRRVSSESPLRLGALPRGAAACPAITAYALRVREDSASPSTCSRLPPVVGAVLPKAAPPTCVLEASPRGGQVFRATSGGGLI
jgi:hypothetical protein